MTEDRNPATPGMSEVSAKFVDEAEAAKVAAMEDLVPAMIQRYRAARDDADAKIKAMEECPDETFGAILDPINDQQRECYMTPATTLAGVLAKVRLHFEERHPSWENLGSLQEMPLDQIEAVSVLRDLERMAQGIVATIKEPVIDEPLLALERRWREAMRVWREATPESPPKPSPDDMDRAVNDAQEEMAATPARTIAGVLVKLHLYANLNGRAFRTNLDDVQGIGPVVSIDRLPLDNLELDEKAVVTAMRDLERLAHTTTVAETPPTADTALFDALAEYDRLAAISEGLERRKDVFRPGIPEAKEATEAYETAWDEAMKAWDRARNTPATTQAGLFAKLQAMVQYGTYLGEANLYETDWSVIKADVQRIADRGLERVAALGAVVTATNDNGLPPLDGETAVRIEELANEAIDLNQGVRRLLDCELEQIPTTGKVLTREIDNRLARLINLLDGEDEEARS